MLLLLSCSRAIEPQRCVRRQNLLAEGSQSFYELLVFVHDSKMGLQKYYFFFDYASV